MKPTPIVVDPSWWRATMLMMLLGAGLALTGCNTVEGAGQDLSAAGEKIEDTSRDVRR